MTTAAIHIKTTSSWRWLTPVGLFSANGLVLGAWAAAIPTVASRLHLSAGWLAVILLAFAVGGIGMMLATPAVLRWLPPTRLAWVSGLLFAGMLGLPLLAPTWLAAVLGAALFGVAHGAMDVSMNAAAIAYERQRQRPILSRLHGCFSVGAAFGSFLGGLLTHAKLPLWSYASSVAGLAILFLLPAWWQQSGSQDLQATQSQAHPQQSFSDRNVLIALAWIAFACLVAEGAMVDWLVQYAQGLEITPSWAAAVYTAFAVGMAVGRFTGDSLRYHVTDGIVVGLGLFLASSCLGLALSWPNFVWKLSLLFLTGLGVANVVPLVFRAATIVGQPAASLAFVTACGYAGLLTGPPVLGLLAEVVGLRGALFLVVVGLGLASVCTASYWPNPRHVKNVNVSEGAKVENPPSSP